MVLIRAGGMNGREVRVTADGSFMGVTVEGLEREPFRLAAVPASSADRVDLVAVPEGGGGIRWFVDRTKAPEGFVPVAYVRVPRGAAVIHQAAVVAL